MSADPEDTNKIRGPSYIPLNESQEIKGERGISIFDGKAWNSALQIPQEVIDAALIVERFANENLATNDWRIVGVASRKYLEEVEKENAELKKDLETSNRLLEINTTEICMLEAELEHYKKNYVKRSELQPKPSVPTGNFVENNDFKLSFKIGSDKESGIIALQDFIDKYSKELSIVYFNTREKAIQAELKKLGWASPEESEELKKRVEELEVNHPEGYFRFAMSELESNVQRLEAQNATLRAALEKIEGLTIWRQTFQPAEYMQQIAEDALAATPETSVSRRPREERLETLLRKAVEVLKEWEDDDRVDSTIKAIDQELSQEI